MYIKSIVKRTGETSLKKTFGAKLFLSFCLAAAWGAPALLAPEAAAANSDSQIEKTQSDIDRLEKEIGELDNKIGKKCSPPSQSMRRRCQRWEKEKRLSSDKLKQKRDQIPKLQTEKADSEESQDQEAAYQEAVKEKVKKQEKILKITALLSGAAAAYLFTKCNKPPGEYMPCVMGLLAANQALQSLGKAAELDDVCMAMGNSACNSGGPNPSPPPVNCEGPPSICDPGGPISPPSPGGPSSPGGEGYNPHAGFSPDDADRLNREVAGCNFDPGCFQAGPGGSLQMNSDILPKDLKDAEFAGGDKKMTSEDIVKKMNPKQKAKFAKALEGVGSQNPGLVSEMQALGDDEISEDGEEADDEIAGRIAGGNFQGGASLGGAAGGSSGYRRSRGPEEDSIDKQVKALLNRIKKKQGKKDKGSAGKAVMIGRDKVGGIENNIFLMMRNRYQEQRKNSQFIETERDRRGGLNAREI